MIRTARIGPIEQRAHNPKLSSSVLFPARTAEAPAPSARMKGTVMGPVVTPPASNPTPMYSGAVNAATMKTRA